MTEEQIKQEVERYINDTLYNYAIMIDGEWGSGKTYFVKHTLLTELENIEKENKQNRLVKYLSLYGFPIDFPSYIVYVDLCTRVIEYDGLNGIGAFILQCSGFVYHFSISSLT